MSRMNEFSVEEALRQFRSFRDDQFRANLAHDRRIKALDTENQELKLRLSVLTRLLISKGVITAAEFATTLVEAAPSEPTAVEQVEEVDLMSAVVPEPESAPNQV